MPNIQFAAEKLRYHYAKRITLLGAGANIFLAIIKVVFGLLGQSHVLVADGLHSFSDLLTDFLVLAAAKFGNQAADAEHPYGHHRIETLGTVGLALILISVGVFVMIDAGSTLFSDMRPPIPSKFVLIIAGISLLINESLFRYSLYIAEKVDSQLLRANAWHRRSDAATSLIVLVGVIGSLIGLPILDPLGAIIVGLLIIKMGWHLGWNGLRELIDTGVDAFTLDKINQSILAIPGIKSIHDLRTRMMAGKILIDVHVLVNPRLSVSEGHYIGDQVYLKLLREHPAVTYVAVHVDPEDDEQQIQSINLPSRQELIPILNRAWQDLPEAKHISTLTLHYLAGKMHVELGLPISALKNHSSIELTKAYKNALPSHLPIASLKLWFG